MQIRSNKGFTLVEIVIVMLIVSILTAIALPGYTKYVTRSRRAAAEACLMIHANFMERFYATNMRYDQDTSTAAMNTAALTALALDCATTNNTGKYYAYSLSNVGQATYTLSATPQGTQLKNDTSCGTVTVTQSGVRGKSGTGSLSDCWAR